MAYRILVADDEAEIREVLRLYLEKEGYEVAEAADGAEAVRQIKSGTIDLAILDIMMPGLNGYRVLQNVREENNLPVLMLSAKSSDSDKILGLDLGADDYITKPFVPLEVVARVRSHLRRFYALGGGDIRTDTGGAIQVGDLRLELDSCLLYRNGERIELTSVEFRIMRLFMENPGRVFTKQQIFEAGWEEEYMVSDNNVMVCISKLRGKLAREGREYISTIRGLGYRMEKE
ncbi:MAG: response regulator transcription factor [Lachnospiraceae bacterium]|nr:response regulator transcription factor [Lachnospiraceae bacterium]